MEINIREATTSDFNQINALFREFAEFENLPERMTNTVDQMMEEKEYFNCFVAETPDGEIAGYVTYFFGYYTWVGKSLYMDDLYVRPAFRGQGVGSLLIHKIITYAKVSGCHRLRWQVSGWNKPAIGFYKKLGATISGVEQNCDLSFSF
ncbi:GNAT family N-acetyltransferase [Bacteroides timonensis]|uniref:GNAT family N-acetyltransferase n=1 Tax=Bacteroides timonensis TaxID=1470345 RepID=UPI0004B2FB75|nr:GNAT family N-acetyltransferase [Bacteroides timonensis]